MGTGSFLGWHRLHCSPGRLVFPIWLLFEERKWNSLYSLGDLKYELPESVTFFLPCLTFRVF